MPLPVLTTRGDLQPGDLVRLYHRTELHWARHLGEEVPLDAGVAIVNKDLPRVWDANRVLDAAVPAGAAPAEAVAEAERIFGEQGVRCCQWAVNPAAPEGRTAPLVEHLVSSGWKADPADILYLSGAPVGRVRESPGLTIIPARASFRHARQLAEESATRWNEPQVAEAILLHLDDSHWDALLAIRDGTAVGYAGVLAVGDVGRIDELYVARDHRRDGIGRTMMSRVLETCVRSQFRHVMLDCALENVAARSLYRQLGFRKIGQIVAYRDNGCSPSRARG